MRRPVLTLLAAAAAAALVVVPGAAAQAADQEFITVAQCVHTGGEAIPDWLSPTARSCLGGRYDGYPVWPR
ncbi:hypothetical protein ACIBIZ_29560 [Nonomuraea spiralis]|uniref:hypothetical protein n=1 Tax=Nonomuraea TaxID=83681 RepID=UPI000F76777E|nr:hypothetical protein [Nonomuraea sp. WAC 01424]RSM99189.1 hypothetical protein DMB42_43400 [Nonomuraea sp. WAC 01424]